MAQESKDFLKMKDDSHLKNNMDEDETVILSARVSKFNDFKKEQTRVLIITNKNLFNVITPNFFTNMAATLMGDDAKVKRKISLKKIAAITISKSGSQFLIHVPDEYDYLFQSENEKEIIIQSLVEQYCIINEKESLSIFFKDDQKLFNYLTTKQDKRNNQSKMPTTLPLFVKPSDYKNIQAQQKSLRIEDFKILKVIGKGTFGKVMLAQKKDNGELLAIKSLRKQAIIEHNNVKHIKAERKILETMSHPFLVDLRYAFKSEDKLFFAMPFISGGDLFQMMKMQGKISEERTRLYVAELVLALQFMHNKDIVYRDLKPENILIDKQGHICLADFGLAKYITNESQHNMTFAGTPMYIAPEMIESQLYGREIDWWGLGIIMYEMLFSSIPFYNENSNFLFSMILNQKVKFPQSKFVSDEAYSLIDAFLQKDPKYRIGSYYVDPKNQKQVYGGDEIMTHPFFNGFDWKKCLQKQIQPEWRPDLKSEIDTNNFDEEFTDLKPADSIVIQQKNQKKNKKDDDNAFQDFDYKHQNI